MLSNFLICYMHNLMPSLLSGERRLLGIGKGDLLEKKVTIWYCYVPIHYGYSCSALYLGNTQDKVKYIEVISVWDVEKIIIKSPILSATLFTPQYFIF